MFGEKSDYLSFMCLLEDVTWIFGWYSQESLFNAAETVQLAVFAS